MAAQAPSGIGTDDEGTSGGEGRWGRLREGNELLVIRFLCQCLFFPLAKRLALEGASASAASPTPLATKLSTLRCYPRRLADNYISL